MSARPLIAFQGVTRRFGSLIAVDRVSLAIGAGEFFCLLGPSGCGKSTLLRMLAGFEDVDEGRILLDGQDLGAEPPHRRPLNMMVQSYALFPHLTVAQNVGYGLRWLPMRRRERAERVTDMLRLVRLEEVADRYPAAISGGQSQRAALARALARRPRVLLLDEPLGALDRRLREDTQAELKALQTRLGTTFLMVTHDAGEAMTLADRIAVMDRGRVAQVGTPGEVYARPANRFVAGFLGDVNLFAGRVLEAAGGTVRVAIGMPAHVIRIGTAGGRLSAGAAVTVAVRPEAMRIEAGEGGLGGTVRERRFLGHATVFRVDLPDGETARVLRPAGAEGADPGGPGTRVRLAFEPAACTILPS